MKGPCGLWERGQIPQLVAANAATSRFGLERGFAEAEGVGDYGDGAKAHGGAGEHGAEEPAGEWIEDAGGDGNAEGVVKGRESEALAGVAHGGPTQAASAHAAAQSAFRPPQSGDLD